MTHQKAPYRRGAAPRLKRVLHRLTHASALSLTLGCTPLATPDTFTFVPALPPDFEYELNAVYLPAKGQTCTLKGERNAQLGFNKIGMKYEASSEIGLYKTSENCPMELTLVEIKIIGLIGRDNKRSYTTYDFASFAVRPKGQRKNIGTFNSEGEGHFLRECQWLFRTIGPKRYLTKILDCKNTGAQENLSGGDSFMAYSLDQLSGKTVTMTIKLAAVEEPYMMDTWVKVPNGWKRCMGKGFEDQHAFRYGNHTDFSTFRMLDERVCTIYPGCTENKDETHEH